MKKLFLVLAAFSLLAFLTVSCDPNDDNTNNQDSPSNPSNQTNPDTPGGTTLNGFNQNGASNALFSVSAIKQVRFSRGNLQYRASDGTWRFAEHQYDIIGSDNANISSTFAGWIDLFGWGTSGWSGSGATYYHPYDTYPNDGGDTITMYGPLGSDDLTGSYANADWGVYNAISNGGNRAGMWRTLTKDEWSYLLGTSGSRQGKYSYATIDGMHKGVIVLPDSWVTPEGLTYTTGTSYTTNTYSSSEWLRMEAAGAVFLPTTRKREYTFTSHPDYGYYWSASATYSEGHDDYSDVSWRHTIPYYLYFQGNGDVRVGYTYGSFGFAVRLVQDN